MRLFEFRFSEIEIAIEIGFLKSTEHDIFLLKYGSHKAFRVQVTYSFLSITISISIIQQKDWAEKQF